MQAASTRTAPSRVRYAMAAMLAFVWNQVSANLLKGDAGVSLGAYKARGYVLLVMMMLALWVLWSWCSKCKAVCQPCCASSGKMNAVDLCNQAVKNVECRPGRVQTKDAICRATCVCSGISRAKCLFAPDPQSASTQPPARASILRQRLNNERGMRGMAQRGVAW